MVYLFVSMLFPSDKAPDAGKKFLEQLKKYPDDETLGESLVDAAVKTTEAGIRAVSVTRVAKGKLEENLIRANNILAMYNEVEGLEYTIEFWQEPAEALATIGLKMPD